MLVCDCLRVVSNLNCYYYYYLLWRIGPMAVQSGLVPAHGPAETGT